MRPGVIQRIVSRLLWFAFVSQLVPLAVGIAYRFGVGLGTGVAIGDVLDPDWHGSFEERWWAFAITAALSAIAAWSFARLPAARSADRDSLRRREGFLAVTLGWLILVWVTAVGFYLTGDFAGFAEAWFESMSGFTTTGASVITNIEGLPHAVLFMRSFAHWIGGMGIIVLSVAILPELAVGGMQLFSAESSGIDSDKLAPRIAATARRLWVLYFTITAFELVLLWIGGMSFFDAINHAMATIATGGFSTKNSSVASFDSVYIEMVILVFMFVSGMSFTTQYRAFFGGQPRRLLDSPEVRLYTALTLVAVLFLTLDVWARGTYDGIGQSLRFASFNAVSIITTTGFGTADFDAWPHLSRLTLVGLMLIGGCAGSTAGGSKVVRLYVVAKHATVELRKLVRPHLVQPLQIGDREVPRETAEAVMGFYLLYFAAIMVGALAMTAVGMDLVSGTTASISAMNSIGPGLGTVGAAQNFGGVPDAGLYVLSFGMLLGRLEIYTVLVLFSSHFWRRG